MQLHGRWGLLKRSAQDSIELLGGKTLSHATNEPHWKTRAAGPRNDILLTRLGIARFEPWGSVCADLSKYGVCQGRRIRCDHVGDLDSLAYRDPWVNAAVNRLEASNTKKSAHNRLNFGRFVQVPVDKLIEATPGCSYPQSKPKRESLVTTVKRRSRGELAQDLANKQPLGFGTNERTNSEDTGR